MELKLHDTLTGKERTFTPLDTQRVRMYVCGPTVYDYAHIGNARPLIVFDLLYRLLKRLYKDRVVYVRNITDVDDKINARAAEEYPELPLNEAIRRVTEKTEKQFHKDAAALRCLVPTIEPRATEHITEMRRLIDRLVDIGDAYVADEHVLFSVKSMPEYGQLSKRTLDEMIAGARVEVAPYKRDPMDFVLWKPSKPGEPAWPSPVGITTPGRPGWHIECSAMAWKHLGETFDIHGGGVDLIFPHHENEIAQSRCAFHTPLMANFWIHNGFLQVEGEKMSKSLGNFVTIRDLIKTTKFGGRRWKGEVIRLAMLQTHYRQPLDWTVRSLEQSASRLERWKEFASGRMTRKINKQLQNEFLSALCDNLNTPGAFSVIDGACKTDSSDERDRYTVARCLRLLGFRNKKSPAAQLVSAMDPFVNTISALSQTHWKKLFDNLRSESASSIAPEAKLYAYVDAVESLQNDLPKNFARDLYSNDFLQSYLTQLKGVISPAEDDYKRRIFFYHRFLDAPYEKQVDESQSVRLIAQQLSEAIDPILKKISSLSANDWKNLAENVRRRPTFASGEPKPETKLFAYLVAIAWLGEQLRDLIAHHQKNEQVARLRQQFSEIMTPRKRSFEARIAKLVDDRNAARAARQFEEADRIRDKLKSMGIELEDNKDGTTTWKIAQ
jgi:cysteinyl-tRNA synthetase